MSADFWILVFFVFLFGVLIGWILHRRTDAHGPQAGAAQPAKLDAVEAELKNAKQHLEASDADAAIAAEQLTGVDDALRRANERLKLIIKAVKGARLGE